MGLLKNLLQNPLLLNKKWDFKWVFKSGICKIFWPKSVQYNKSSGHCHCLTRLFSFKNHSSFSNCVLRWVLKDQSESSVIYYYWRGRQGRQWVWKLGFEVNSYISRPLSKIYDQQAQAINVFLHERRGMNQMQTTWPEFGAILTSPLK